MKVIALTARSLRHSSVVDPIQRVAGISRRSDGGCSLVLAGQQSQLRQMGDQDLAQAAFAQAVALYDSCVERALVVGRRESGSRSW